MCIRDRYCSLQETDTISDEHYEKLLQEVVSLEENVLENSKDTELRHSAIQLLCYAYPKLNMPEKAESLANTMPYAHQCREDLLVSVSDKTKRYKALASSCDNLYADGYFLIAFRKISTPFDH